MSVGEIAEAMGCRGSMISKQLRQLLKYNEIKTIEVDRFVAITKYKCKRRMKIYYV